MPRASLLTLLIQPLLGRHRAHAQLRKIFLVTVVGIVWLCIILLETIEPIATRPVMATPIAEIRNLNLWINVAWHFISPVTLRHFILPLVGFIGAFWVGAYYLDDLFELQNPSLAYQHLWSSLFGSTGLGMHIENGQVREDDQKKAIYRIGGPGHVVVHLGNAALFERSDGSLHIVESGSSAMAGFERLRAALDLRTQHLQMEEIAAHSCDGLPITLRDVQARYRLYGFTQPSVKTPYPIASESVLAATYGCAVSETGLETWQTTVERFARTQIRSYLSRYTLDSLLAAEDEGTLRRELTALFYQPDQQQELKKLGVQMEWIGVGTLQPKIQFTAEQIEQTRASFLTTRISSPNWAQQEQAEAAITELLRLVGKFTNHYRYHKVSDSVDVHDLLNFIADELTQVQVSLGEQTPPGIPILITQLRHLAVNIVGG